MSHTLLKNLRSNGCAPVDTSTSAGASVEAMPPLLPLRGSLLAQHAQAPDAEFYDLLRRLAEAHERSLGKPCVSAATSEVGHPRAQPAARKKPPAGILSSSSSMVSLMSLAPSAVGLPLTPLPKASDSHYFSEQQQQEPPSPCSRRTSLASHSQFSSRSRRGSLLLKSHKALNIPSKLHAHHADVNAPSEGTSSEDEESNSEQVPERSPSRGSPRKPPTALGVPCSELNDDASSKLDRQTTEESQVFVPRFQFVDMEAGKAKPARVSTAVTLKPISGVAPLPGLEIRRSCEILHPGHRKRLLWDLLGMLVLFYDAVTIPFHVAFEPETALSDHIFNWSILLFWTCDVLLSCMTGYYVQGSLVTRPRAVILHYAKTWMLPDLSIVGLDWVTIIMNLHSETQNKENASKLVRTLKVIRIIRFLRLLRLLKLRRILQEFHEHINSESASIMMSLCTLVVFLLVINHFFACLWYAVGSSEEVSWVTVHDMVDRSILERYLTSLHWALTNIASAMEVRPYNATERLVAVIVLVIGVLMSSAFLSMVTGSMLQLWTLWNEERRQFWLLRRYLRDASISYSLAMRVERYLDYIWRKEQKDVQEQQVQLLARLSEPLRNELKHESFAPHLSQHALFFALCERTKVFLKACTACALAPGDLHFSCGEEADNMTFITDGTLQYMRGSETELDFEEEDGSQVEEVVEGEWVSEAALWVRWAHLGDIAAQTVCQIIMIEAKKFADGVFCNIQVAPVVCRYSCKFIEQVNSVNRADLSDLLERTFSAAETYGVAMSHSAELTMANYAARLSVAKGRMSAVVPSYDHF